MLVSSGNQCVFTKQKLIASLKDSWSLLMIFNLRLLCDHMNKEESGKKMEIQLLPCP